MIRKQNSEFNTSFVSEASKSIENTDCFAHVELDGLAIYVLADGIDEKYGAKAARLCVDSVISSFTEAPSMSKSALKRYAKIAGEALQKEKSRSRLKASIIILVHNYTKMRYLLAGNVRFRLYRDGFLKYESKDQSLGMDFVLSEKIQKDKLAIHEERHNLQSYIGQGEGFKPFLSKKVKLMNSDSIALFTRGYWENIDDGELLDVFKDAGKDSQEIVDVAEEILLSKQPENLESYSFVTIFVNKTFINPNIKRNIKKAIMIAIPIIVTIVTISVILFIRYKNKQEKIALMEENYIQTVEYILSDNYVKAEGKANETVELATEVKDDEMKEDATNYLMLVESVIAGDENLESKKYEDAQIQYLNALNRSRYADNMAKRYIEDKLALTSNYISVYDLINLGDTQVLNLQYDDAEEKYLEAKALASKIYFEEGRQNALTALDDLYELQKENEEKLKEETDKAVEDEALAASFLAKGDTAFEEQDYQSALVYYTSAQQKYDELEDIVNSALVEKKIDNTQIKLGDADNKADEAIDYVKKAEESEKSKDYVQAEKYYLLAKDIYASLNDEDKVKEITSRIDILNLDKEDDDEKKEVEENKMAATSFLEKGDKAFLEKDYETAIEHYKSAKEKYTELNDSENIDMIQTKIKIAEEENSKIKELQEEAKGYLDKGNTFYIEKNYEIALNYYKSAEEKYKELNDTESLEIIKNKISIIEEEIEKMKEEEAMNSLENKEDEINTSTEENINTLN